jgi:hypothetical protein
MSLHRLVVFGALAVLSAVAQVDQSATISPGIRAQASYST